MATAPTTNNHELRRADHRPANDSHDSAAPTKPPRWKVRRKWLIIVVAVFAVVGAGLYFGRHFIHRELTTESTDDAYVNCHMTTVSGRVSGQVIAVYVDDNDRVKQGDLLLEIDHQPYQVAVAQKKAALQTAEANLASGLAQTRSQVAKSRSGWYNLVKAQESVRAQVAAIHADVANLKVREAQLKLDEIETERSRRLVAKDAGSKEDLDQRLAAVETDRQQVVAAKEAIRKDRATLGLGPNDEKPTEVPADLEQTNSAVQQALSDVVMTLAQIGVPVKLDRITPEGLKKYLDSLDPGRDIEFALGRFVDLAPAVQQPRASVAQAQEDLRNAELNLSYTYVYAPIAGQINKRSVNPGDNASSGQGLMSVISQTDVWIDANFKETQLAKIRIGHPVEFTVDAYPGKVFHGRVEGFGAGTGQAQALLPPENATGNFVKIVQRLPVRLRVNPEDLDPDTPLFVGLSVLPMVKYEEQATGPDAGRRLLDPVTQRAPSRTTLPPLPVVPVSVPGKKAP